MKKILISLLFPLSLLADTTGNLLTNGTFENNNSNGWTTSGDVQVLSDCCGSNYDLEFGDSGSIEQSFDLTTNTITQPMLNNGITLNSSVQVQNGECGVSGCWGGSGPADTFIIRLQIRDSESNILATTTQERTDVTGINGEDFTDTVSYTGTGSNIGNIFISGTDGNSPATLGGPNLDNISVTMTYDPTLLSAQETANIATAFEEIEQVLSTEIETVEFEEFTEIPSIALTSQVEFTQIEEYLPEIKELAIEEINTGIVEIFTVAIEEEIIPMEVSYEEPQTIEAFTTEVESFEEAVETTETINYETETPGEEVSTGGGNEETNTNIAKEQTSNTETGSKETIVAEKQGGTERVSSEEVTATDERESASEDASSSESSGETNTDSDTSTNPESGSGVESDSEVSEVASQSIQVEDVAKQVAQTIKELDQQLVVTSNIVASLMVTSNLDSYTNMNQDILIQPLIDGGNIDEYFQRNYSDGRNIYSETQVSYKDPVFLYQTKVQETVDEVIRAKEHLRRIRGY